jgi:ketosteroid isomerase-like protein
MTQHTTTDGKNPPTLTPHTATSEVITAFNDAFNRRSTDQVAPLLTDDCIFDGTTPPDGERHVGRDDVLAAFTAVFQSAAHGEFTTEEMIVTGDRAVVRWRYDWTDHAGQPGHVRGVDLFRVREGRVAEKLAYVKG